MSQENPTPEKCKIYFSLEDMEVEAPVGTSFFDVVSSSGADVTFGCLNGTCGTCRVQCAEINNLSPMLPEEKQFLESMDAPHLHRLGCQIKIIGNVTIEYIG
jgi:ferredoxin